MEWLGRAPAPTAVEDGIELRELAEKDSGVTADSRRLRYRLELSFGRAWA